MYFINPYHTIFNDNDWIYNEKKQIITYGTCLINVTNIYIYIPLVKNNAYNKRLIHKFNIFLYKLNIKLQNRNTHIPKLYYKKGEYVPFVIKLNTNKFNTSLWEKLSVYNITRI